MTTCMACGAYLGRHCECDVKALQARVRELESAPSPVLDLLGKFKEENVRLRKVVDAARGAVEWHMKQPLAHYTMVELRNSLNKYDELDGEKK